MKPTKEQRKHVYNWMLKQLNDGCVSPFLCNLLDDYNETFIKNFVLIDFPELVRQRQGDRCAWFFEIDGIVDYHEIRIRVLNNALIYLNTEIV
jgi:hypothetical protein